MNWIEKKCLEELELYKRPTLNIIEWFKKNAILAFILCLFFILELPVWILFKAVKVICFIPYAVYEKLDELDY